MNRKYIIVKLALLCIIAVVLILILIALLAGKRFDLSKYISAAYADDADIETTSGDIMVESIGKGMLLSTMSGDIRVKSAWIGENSSIKSTSGDVVVR